MADDIERCTKTLPLTDNLRAEIAALEAEGWDLAPDTVPQITYELQRRRGFAGKVTFTIDDSKVHVIRNGKIVG